MGDIIEIELTASGNDGSTAPFVGSVSTDCSVRLLGYRVLLMNTEGTFTTEFPWQGSSYGTRLRPYDEGPFAISCGLAAMPSPPTSPLPPPSPHPPSPVSPPTPSPSPPQPPSPPPPSPPASPPPPLSPCIGSADVPTFEFEDREIAYNNLGGLGPHVNGPSGLRFVNVLSAPIGGIVTPLDLLVTNTTTYSADQPERNGIDGKVSRINFACNTQSGLRVQVYPSCSTAAVTCKACDSPVKTAAEQASCYAAGCSCFGSTCYSSGCCAGNAKEQKRLSYICPNSEYTRNEESNLRQLTHKQAPALDLLLVPPH